MRHADMVRKGAAATNAKLSPEARKKNATKASQARWRRWRKFSWLPVKKDLATEVEGVARDRDIKVEDFLEDVIRHGLEHL